MIGVTVEFMAVEPSKIVHKEFKNHEAACRFLIGLEGEHFTGSLDDGTFAVYVGWKNLEKGQ